MADRKRRFLGLYSGAAAEGIDAVVVEIRGRGQRMRLSQIDHRHVPYKEGLRRRIVAATGGRTESIDALAELDRDVGLAFATVARSAIARADTSDEAPIVAVGSSGQLIHRAARGWRAKQRWELLAGAPAVVAAAVSLPVVSGFSATDLAVGGWGGPVCAWPFWRIFADRRLSRVVLHLGGIAGLTFVGAAALHEDVVAFDVGPGTLLIDQLSHQLFDRPFDADGTIASRGRVNRPLLDELLSDPSFHQPPPKQVVRSQWDESAVWRITNLGRKHRCEGAGLLATVTELTAQSAATAIATLTERPHEVILCGGGARNIHLAGRIRKLLSPCSTYTCERYGLGLRAAKGAALAMLAAARMDKFAAHCPAATGAERAAVLGSVTLP